MESGQPFGERLVIKIEVQPHPFIPIFEHSSTGIGGIGSISGVVDYKGQITPRDKKPLSSSSVIGYPLRQGAKHSSSSIAVNGGEILVGDYELDLPYGCRNVTLRQFHRATFPQIFIFAADKSSQSTAGTKPRQGTEPRSPYHAAIDRIDERAATSDPGR